MPRAFNLQFTLDRAGDRAEAWAFSISKRAAELHRDAPRGGTNLNRYGDRRSAPGEVPATEEGRLLDLIRLGTRPIRRGGEATVNYKKLEEGNEGVAPRPLGVIVMAEIRAIARSGAGPGGVT